MTKRQKYLSAVQPAQAVPAHLPGNITGPQDAYRVLEGQGATVREQEAFYVLSLNGRNRVLSVEMIALGAANSVCISPCDIFRPAIRLGAVAVIIAHNHPSGDPAPSEEDKQVTERTRKAGELLGITLLDHLIVAKRSFWSLLSGVQQETVSDNRGSNALG